MSPVLSPVLTFRMCKFFVCVRSLVLMDLAVLFTASKGSLMSAPVAKCGHFKGQSASASHS